MAIAYIEMQGTLGHTGDDTLFAAQLRAQLTRSNWYVTSISFSGNTFRIVVQGSTSDNLNTVKRVFQNQTGAYVSYIAFVTSGVGVVTPSGQTNTNLPLEPAHTQTQSTQAGSRQVVIRFNISASTGTLALGGLYEAIKASLISHGWSVVRLDAVSGIPILGNTVYQLTANVSNQYPNSVIPASLYTDLAEVGVVSNVQIMTGNVVNDTLSKLGSAVGASTGSAVMVGALIVAVGVIVLTQRGR